MCPTSGAGLGFAGRVPRGNAEGLGASHPPGPATEMHSALALNRPGSPTRNRGKGLRLRIGGGPRAAGRARKELAGLGSQLDGPMLDTLRLLVTELVANSVRHAGAAAVDLVVVIDSHRVRVEICNPGSTFEPHVGGGGRESESGWGLFLVDRLSDGWGVEDEAGYQRVWFEIRRRAELPASAAATSS